MGLPAQRTMVVTGSWFTRRSTATYGHVPVQIRREEKEEKKRGRRRKCVGDRLWGGEEEEDKRIR